MDCSLTEGLTNVGQDSSGKDGSSSDDDVPLSKLVTKPHSEKKQLREKSPTVGSKAKAKSASDDSSDDEPLIKKKRVPAPNKKPQKKGNTPIRSNGTSNKKADLNTDDSSDNEPLIKITKAAKKPISVPPKKTVRAKKKKASDDSDDEPLSKLVNKLERKARVTPSKRAIPDTKARRNVATKKVKYAESSSDGSDDEPLADMKKKLTKVPKKNSTNKKTKPKRKDKPLKDSSASDSSSDDDDDEDDVPLVNLISKRQKPVKKTTKKTAVSRGSASRKRREPSDESSDDEPLINFVEKKSTGKQTNTKTKASAPKKRNTTPNKSRKTVASGSSNDSSDDEPLIKKMKHPQVTKNLRITLERCDGEDGGATLSPKKTSTDAPIAEKTSSDKSESSQESSEED
ncbi:uncharacterized protein LKV04_016083 [Tautogolabrus adspersus]